MAIRVLQALCVELPSLGYHQQFAYLVCHTLCHLPEADAFWVVHQILMYYGMSTLFYDNAKNVSILVDHAIQVFRQYLPQLAAHMVLFLYSQHLTDFSHSTSITSHWKGFLLDGSVRYFGTVPFYHSNHLTLVVQMYLGNCVPAFGIYFYCRDDRY